MKYEQGYTGATHMTNVFVKGTILFLQCVDTELLWQSTQRVAWHGGRDYRLNLELAVCAEKRRACKRE